MKNLSLIVFLLLITTIGVAQTAQLNLMPVPKKINLREGKFRINPALSISVSANPSDKKTHTAANRLYKAIIRKTGLTFQDRFITAKNRNDSAEIQIRIDKPVEISIGVDETYTLSVTEKGLVLRAQNSIGGLRGIETILQLLMNDETGFFFPYVQIEDGPRFPWRGLMIDVARHFIPLEVLKRNLDAMAVVKLNVLHLHLSDDEGFRVESKTFPKLHLLGSNGLYFTQAQIKELIAYADMLGILIVPEFDLPGHSKSWFAGYPELGSAPGPYEPGLRFNLTNSTGGTPNLAEIMASPTPTLDPTKENVYQFLDAFYKEMAALFPAPYLHIGADENNGVAWKNNAAIVSFMQKKGIKDVHALQEYFVGRAYNILKKYKKTMIGWEELNTKSLAKDVIVQKWIPEGVPMVKSFGSPAEIAAKGNKVLVSAGFYTDLFLPAYIHYHNPTLPQTQLENLLGGEAAQWTELADELTIETRIWPRVAAIAERLWSPVSVKDTDDMYRRLFILSNYLDEQGLQHIKSYEEGLRRLAMGKNIDNLKTLTDVLTPLKGYKNLFAAFTKSPRSILEPGSFTALSQIIFVDSETKRIFRSNVSNYLKNKNATTESLLKKQLSTWKQNHEKLSAEILTNPRLKDLEEHSRNLSELGGIGLEALAKWQDENGPAEEWIKTQLGKLESYRKAYAETEISVIPEIEALIKGELSPEPRQYPLF